LKQLIEEVVLAEPYIGEQIPTRWLQFENDLHRLKKQQDNFYASLDQVYPNFNLFFFNHIHFPLDL
jgi:hypothetical protein